MGDNALSLSVHFSELQFSCWFMEGAWTVLDFQDRHHTSRKASQVIREGQQESFSLCRELGRHQLNDEFKIQSK